MKKLRTYDIMIVKECYAKVKATSEAEAKEIGHSLYGEENYDDTTIRSVRCLGETDFSADDDWSDDEYCEDDMLFEEEYYDDYDDEFDDDDDNDEEYW